MPLLFCTICVTCFSIFPDNVVFALFLSLLSLYHSCCHCFVAFQSLLSLYYSRCHCFCIIPVIVVYASFQSLLKHSYHLFMLYSCNCCSHSSHCCFHVVLVTVISTAFTVVPASFLSPWFLHYSQHCCFSRLPGTFFPPLIMSDTVVSAFFLLLLFLLSSVSLSLQLSTQLQCCSQRVSAAVSTGYVRGCVFTEFVQHK